jgi:pyridoxamine 5'-phosphate oxidase
MLPTTIRIPFTCLCLSASRVSSYQRSIVAFSPLTSSALIMASSKELGSSSVGQVDIGRDNQYQDNDNVPGKMSWRARLEISNAKSRKIRGSNFVQLATIDATSNEPRCRCVVFRGFLNLQLGHDCRTTCDDLPCVLKMCTDRRSEKVNQILSHPTAEMVWWFPRTSEQYRIRGRILLVGSGELDRDDDGELAVARKQLWGNLSDAARESFLAEHAPGKEYVEPPSTLPIAKGGRTLEGDLLPPPDAFLLMLLIPNHCDYLRLTNMYRQVDELGDAGWSSQRVNP